jgi:NitT/TauT family transport system permease protein
MPDEFGTDYPEYPQPSTASAAVTTALAAGFGGLDSLFLPPPSSGRRQTARKGWAVIWPKLAAIALVFVIWEVVHLTGWKKWDLPGPGVTMSDLWAMAQTRLLWSAISTTLERAVIGFALAMLIGVVVGALVSRIRPLRAAVGSLLTGLQTMPSIVWFPFAIIFFGLNTTAILFVVVLGAAPSIANGLIAGIDYTPPLLLKAGTMMGLRRVSLYRFLILPASLPTFVAGLKQGWAFAWRSLMAGELLVLVANRPSIGVLLANYQSLDDMASVISIMIVILIIGLAVDSAFGAADKAIRRRWGLV